MRSEYMHWAKTQAPVRFHLASSEVPHFRLDRFPIDIADLELDGASRYRYPPLRAAIARKCGVSADRVVMADGTSLANMLAMSALLSPGDEVVAEHPAYEPMTATAEHLGAKLRRFTRRGPGFTIDLAALEAAVTPATRLILLTNLHNPTGNLTDEATLRGVAAIAERVGAYVLIDEVYLDAATPRPQSAHLLSERFVVTSSLTKCYGLSGLRCGWILAAPELAERMWRLNELFGVAQAHPAEQLSLLALERLDEIAADTPALLARNRALANAFFESRNDLEVAPMVHGITAFPRLRHRDVDELNARLRADYDTSIVPGRFFGLADHFRIGVGGPTDTVEEGLSRLGAALDAAR
ncbi:MAG: aminotransferase class I/II-fold pyridoxal phosphate-dependent enzyme [Sphingosinicella sp.]|uniref:aminotransferase class I/II-fold pyridoxal phosphate-dependent enzyme n=1 Tax=Sphingosinicella sp. TaxID=1917971 RepID=UPI0040376C0B